MDHMNDSMNAEDKSIWKFVFETADILMGIGCKNLDLIKGEQPLVRLCYYSEIVISFRIFYSWFRTCKYGRGYNKAKRTRGHHQANQKGKFHWNARVS